MVVEALVTGVAAIYCLLAVWAAIGSGHWFVRACVLLASLALLVPIRAYEPLILFGMTSVLLTGGWGLGKRLRAPNRDKNSVETQPGVGGYRFRLSDLLLACAVAAAGSWMVSVLVENGVRVTWWRAAGTAGLLAVIASLAASVVLYRGWWWRLLLLLAGVFVADVIDVFVLRCWVFDTEMLDFFRVPPYPASYAIIVFAMLYGQFAVSSLVLSAVAARCERQWRRPALSFAFRGAAALIGAAAIVLCGWVYWRMLDVPRIPVQEVGQENVLPRILELAKASPRPGPTADDAICEELLLLLDQPSFVEWPRKRPDLLTLDSDPQLHLPRYLMRGLSAQAAALRNGGDFDGSADRCLAILRLAPMLDRDGTALHRLESESVLHYGHAHLAKGRLQLSPAKALEAARLIESIAAAREPIRDTELRDRIWFDQITWRHLLMRAIMVDMQGLEMHEPYVNSASYLAERNLCFARLLALDLLIRAHRAEHGSWPATLEEVAPKGHEDLTIDPNSGAPFLYRLDASEFTLYSVGEDETDNGGMFVNIRAAISRKPGFDLDVDAMVRP